MTRDTGGDDPSWRDQTRRRGRGCGSPRGLCRRLGVTAVRNERIHEQGARYRGPVLNRFQLEMTAKQLYPKAFGEWPRHEEGPYPEFPEEERLSDRRRVRDAVAGDL